MSVSVEYSTKEISVIVLSNVLKMLQRRKLIDDIDSLHEKLKEDFTNKSVVEFKIKDNKKISIYQFTGKIASIVQGSPIYDYLKNFTDVHKIIIMKEPTKRTAKQITTE